MDGQSYRKDWSVGVVTGCRDDCISAAPVNGAAAGRVTIRTVATGRDAQRSSQTACVYGVRRYHHYRRP